jgi:hypothetical protein
MKTARTAELAYRRAFQDFAENVKRVQSLTEHPKPDSKALETALVELEKSRVVYNTLRDAWVQQLLPSSGRDIAPVVRQDSPEAYAHNIKTIAGLLWEGAGRPDGTADEDWRRAEEIVRQAATAA